MFLSNKDLFLISKAFLTTALFLPCLALSQQFLSGDYQTVLNFKTTNLTIWNYEAKSKVFIFDFSGLTTQGKTFNRITQLNEQVQLNSGYPRVMNNEEFVQYMESIRRTQANFAFGHDVLVTELVRFFNLADQHKIDLFPEEIALREFVIKQGLIKIWRGFYQAVQPNIVILSIPQQQAKTENEPKVSSLAREAIFSHEISHAEYYTNKYYTDYCRKFWTGSLNDTQRESFLNFFKRYNYSIDNGELVVNEMQAYLMFTPDPLSFNAQKLGVTDEELDTMRSMFKEGRPPTTLLNK